MALGSNRDYKKTHEKTMKAMLARYPVKQWVCQCGRKNYWFKSASCPRCGANRPE